MKVRKTILLALSATAILFLGYIVGETAKTEKDSISGTYVSGFLTLSIDAEQEKYYYADTKNNVYFTGNAELLSNNLCDLRTEGETIPRQIVANSDGTLYVILNGSICAMRKAFDVVVRLDSSNW